MYIPSVRRFWKMCQPDMTPKNDHSVGAVWTFTVGSRPRRKERSTNGVDAKDGTVYFFTDSSQLYRGDSAQEPMETVLPR